MTCKSNIASYGKRTLPHGIRVDVQGLAYMAILCRLRTDDLRLVPLDTNCI